MDIMPAFEAVVGGSNPSGCTRIHCPLDKSYKQTILLKNVDNYVGNVYKGHTKKVSFI